MNSEEIFGRLDADITPQTPHLQAHVPGRFDHVISVDDITNLRILLNTTSSVEEFLRRI